MKPQTPPHLTLLPFLLLLFLPLLLFCLIIQFLLLRLFDRSNRIKAEKAVLAEELRLREYLHTQSSSDPLLNEVWRRHLLFFRSLCPCWLVCRHALIKRSFTVVVCDFVVIAGLAYKPLFFMFML